MAVGQELRGLLTTREPYVRPTVSRGVHPFVQHTFPEIRRDKFNTGEVLDIPDFVATALMVSKTGRAWTWGLCQALGGCGVLC